MGDQVKEAPRLSVHSRFILYSTPAVTSLLFCVTFYQLALHQGLLREIQTTSTVQQQTPSFMQTTDMKQSQGMLRRYARATGSDKGADHELDQYFGKIAEWQLKAVRARCLDNERVCI
jgi:hypothetical protein